MINRITESRVVKCKICNKVVNLESDKYIILEDSYYHLDCWVTNLFRKGGFDKELFGALSMSIDYLLSAKQLIMEVIGKGFNDVASLNDVIDNINNNIQKILMFTRKYILKEFELEGKKNDN